MNSICDKFVQINNRGKKIEYTSNLWNPIFSSFITTHCRQKLHSLIAINPQNIISINTDELFTTESLLEKSSNRIGEFKMKEWKKAIFVSNGVYYLENESKIKQAIRGFRKIDLKEAIYNNLNSDCIEIKRKEALSIRLARILTKYSLEDINKFVEMDKKIYVNHEFKRWFPEINTYKELVNGQYNSFPHHISTFNNLTY